MAASITAAPTPQVARPDAHIQPKAYAAAGHPTIPKLGTGASADASAEADAP